MAPLLLYLPFLFLLWRYTLDDAFISFRYADNWASGHGLVFNPGERVEGFSNFLYVALTTVTALVGLDIPTCGKMIGALSGGACLVILSTRRTDIDDGILAGPVAAALIAASGGFVYHCVAGLESGLHALLVLSTAATFRWRASPLRTLATGMLALAAAANRPEAALLLAAVTLAALVGRNPRRIAAAAACVLLGAGLVAARYAYFGEVVPNTYFAKPGISDPEDLMAGFAYLHEALLADGRYLLVFGAAMAIRDVRLRAAMAPYAVAAGVGLFFCVYSGGDWVARSRFLVPYQPALALAGVAGLASLVTSKKTRRYRTPLYGLFALILAVRLGSAAWFARDMGTGVYDPAHSSEGHVRIGKWLGAHTTEGVSILSDEIGAVGFYSRRRILDMHGLIDAEIARLFSEKRFNDYAGRIAPKEVDAMWTEVSRRLLDREPHLALVDYRGPPDKPINPRMLYPPATRRALEARGFVFVRRFVLDERRPKSILLYRAPGVSPPE